MKGYYLYGVVPSESGEELGPIGIDGAIIKTVPFKKLSAVVHSCEIDIKIPDDEKGAGQWIISHQDAVEKAWEKFGVIAPSSFGTILRGDDPDRATAKWLSDNYESFLSKLKELVGKAEYGVQLFWDIKKISEEVVAGDQELLSLQERIRSESNGIAYLHKKQMEQILKSKLEEKAFNLFKSAYDTIEDMVDGVVIEKLKPAAEGAQMLMNISCLVTRKDEKRLGSLLDELNNVGGYTVRFTGPWPPYSFVGRCGSVE